MILLIVQAYKVCTIPQFPWHVPFSFSFLSPFLGNDHPHMGGCQNYGTLLGTLDIRCRIIIGTPKKGP